MKTESTVKYILRLTVTLLLICAFVALALAGVNAITKDKIAANKAAKTAAALEKVLPGVEGLEKMELAADAGIVTGIYGAGNSYAVEVAPNGFGGAIDLMVGVSTDGTVTGVSVISHAETASLGAECTREDWRSQFTGTQGNLKVSKDGGSIDALTGATVTSRAVTEAVNRAVEFVKEVQP